MRLKSKKTNKTEVYVGKESGKKVRGRKTEGGR